jgi:hypothetical protein
MSVSRSPGHRGEARSMSIATDIIYLVWSTSTVFPAMVTDVGTDPA